MPGFFLSCPHSSPGMGLDKSSPRPTGRTSRGAIRGDHNPCGSSVVRRLSSGPLACETVAAPGELTKTSFGTFAENVPRRLGASERTKEGCRQSSSLAMPPHPDSIAIADTLAVR